MEESVAVVVPERVQVHKEMLHWADPQDMGVAKKIAGETSLWLSQRGGRRQKKLGKVSLQCLVPWRSCRFSLCHLQPRSELAPHA